jgi:hypothetical protein
MNITAIDIPNAVTAILTIIIAVGGVLGKSYITKALSGLACVADILLDVGELIICISKAGEDGALSPEEWTEIKTHAREIQASLQAIQGKFGSILQ